VLNLILPGSIEMILLFNDNIPIFFLLALNQSCSSTIRKLLYQQISFSQNKSNNAKPSGHTKHIQYPKRSPKAAAGL